MVIIRWLRFGLLIITASETTQSHACHMCTELHHFCRFMHGVTQRVYYWETRSEEHRQQLNIAIYRQLHITHQKRGWRWEGMAPKMAQPRLSDTSLSFQMASCHKAYVALVTSYFGQGTESPNLKLTKFWNTAFWLKSPNLSSPSFPAIQYIALLHPFEYGV